MWSTALIAVLATVSSAKRAHEFFAENNYICELCKTVVTHAAKGEDEEMDALYEQFPKLQDRINYFASHPEVVNLDQPEQSCINMQLCSDHNLADLLAEERPLDLSAHIEAVNSNPKSTWTAGVNSKFEGASLKEIKSIMGTIVDPDWTITLKPRDDALVNDDLPESFDARTAWPECESVINHVRD